MKTTALGLVFVIVAVIVTILLLRHLALERNPADPSKE